LTSNNPIAKDRSVSAIFLDLMNGDKQWLLERKRVLCRVLVKNEMQVELRMSTVQCGVVCCSSLQAILHQTARNCMSGDCLDTILEKWVTQHFVIIPLSLLTNIFNGSIKMIR
jgi:hypothetical protein